MRDVDHDVVAHDPLDLGEHPVFLARQGAHVDRRRRGIGDHVVLVARLEARGVGRRAERRTEEPGCRARLRGHGVGVCEAPVAAECGEPLDGLTGRGGQFDRPLGAAEGGDRFGEPRHGVVLMEPAAVTRGAPGAQPQPDEGLLPDLQEVRPPVADRDRVAPDLADGLGRAREPLRTVADDQLRALHAPVFLVGEEDQHEVALGALSGAQQLGDGCQDHGIHVFHVDRAAPPEQSVADDSGERVDTPVAGDSGDDVEVPVQHQGGFVGVSAGDAGHQVRAPRDGLVVLDVEAQLGEEGPDVLGGLALALGATLAVVGRVEPDEVARDAGDLGKIGGVDGGHGHHATPLRRVQRKDPWPGVITPGQGPFHAVREGGLEPPRPIRALAPQASASTYSATRAEWFRCFRNRGSTLPRLRGNLEPRAEFVSLQTPRRAIRDRT